MLLRITLFLVISLSGYSYAQQPQPQYNYNVGIYDVNPRLPLIWYVSDDKRLSWDVGLSMDIEQIVPSYKARALNFEDQENKPHWSFKLNFSF